MKLKYLLSTAVAAFLLSGCEDMSTGSFDNIKVSDNFITIPMDGGDAVMTVTATEKWQFVIDENWPETVTFNKDDNGKTIKPNHDRFGNLINDAADIEKKTASWLTVDKMSGEDGETIVKFTAGKTDAGREIEIALYAGNNKQFVRVRQGSLVAEDATCKEVIAGPDAKTYKVRGICTEIQNTTYGNWILRDDTGEILIYGTLNADGEAQKFSELNIEVGDEVYVEGPKTTYNGTVELVNVSVLELKKSLVKVTSAPGTIEKEGGEITVELEYKGNGVFPTIAEECREWISYVNMEYKAGEPSKLDPNPADIAIVTFNVADYFEEKGPRNGKITFSSHKGEDAASSVTVDIIQYGITPAPTPIADAVKSKEWLTVEGTVVSTKCQRGFVIADGSASLFIFTNKEAFTCKEGDIVKIVGKISGYNCGFQIERPIIIASAGTETEAAAPKVIKGADVDAIIARTENFTAERVSVTGVASLDKYNNLVLKVEGATGSVKSYYSSIKENVIKEFDKKTVTITGYVISRSDSTRDNQALIVVENIKEAK